MKSFVPQQVIVRITMNADRADDLRQVGIKPYARPEEQEAEIEQRHIQAAHDRGVDPFRFESIKEYPDGSVDIRRVPDSGTPIFGRNGQRQVSLTHVMSDMREQFPEYKLVDVNLQKRAENKYVLWIIYELPTERRQEFVPTGAQMLHIKDGLQDVYQHLHAYRNPGKQTVTINVGMPMGPAKKPRDLRIFERGLSIRCVPRSADVPEEPPVG